MERPPSSDVRAPIRHARFRLSAFIGPAALAVAVAAVAGCGPSTNGSSSDDLPHKVVAPSVARDTGEAGGAPVKVLPPANGVYHSAFPDFGGSEDMVTAGRIADFVSLTGKPIVWAYFSNNWFDGIRFPGEDVRTAHNSGTVPFIRMMPRSTWDQGRPDPVYTMQAIAGGKFDGDLRQWAREAKATGIPLMVEFGTEVNGDWFPWNGRHNGGATVGPQRFREAYRRIVDLFRAEGATNVTWVFHVDAHASPEAAWNAMRNYYPGDDYVDWLGISAYGAQNRDEDWDEFTAVLDEGYAELAALSTSKPIALLEFGVTDRYPNRDKGKWIADAFAAIRAGRYPRIKAVSYWHENWEDDDSGPALLRLDSSASALQAYRSAVADPFFTTTVTLGP